MKRLIQYIAIIITLISVSSCDILKQVLLPPAQPIEAIKSDWRVKTNIKGTGISTKVRVEAVREQGIFMSVRPFPFVELARLWFTPQEIFIVDLIDKRYAKVDYSKLPLEFAKAQSFALVEDYVFGLLNKKAEDMDKVETIKLGGRYNTALSIQMLSKEKVSNPYDLSITPKLRDDYREIEFSELQFILKYFLGK